MKITLISVGKIKEKYLRDAINEYSKRLTKYCKLKFIEINDEKAPDNLSEKDETIIKDKEGNKILEKIKDQQYVIVLDLKGKQRTSEEFSKEMENLSIYGNSDIVFVIGGSLGLSDGVIKRSNDQISFSKMTFPHQLMKVILIEQIYRTYRIIKGEPYHK
ncbi:MAG: 23S rRNA (pseudouridine(1915)-N(3))-methyltransferase RlmH [Clostridiales bacterium]|nr:23S rRNA (pseudouridine(1915)-N(3))-methyltransferase RlmH [Clostridiales bacterium]